MMAPARHTERVADPRARGDPSHDTMRPIRLFALTAQALLERSSETARRLTTTRRMDLRIKKALAQIDAQLHDRVSVTRLAADVELSPSRFTHLFRVHVGTSPAQYLRERRMTLALVLLDRTSLPVREVMLHVGCNDPSHFARDFRRFHGFGPRERRTALGIPARADRLNQEELK
jgi:AraC family transcriptional regulator of arabinose operon